MTVTATPQWFGELPRPLFGWLHAPDGHEVRCGVALCPPIGYEATCAHRTLIDLADALADAGFAALRFDYAGTGDSAGANDDPDWVPGWRASAQVALAWLGANVGGPVAAVGMRIGATLVAELDGSHPLAGAVLWDPVTSGRAYVRQLRALQLLGLEGILPPAVDDGSLTVAGTVFHAAALEQLRALTLPDLATRTAPTLVLVRPEHPAPEHVAPCVTVGIADGQAELLDVASLRARVPTSAVDAVVGWLDAALPRDRHPLPDPARSASPATATVSPGVTETSRTIGPMFAVVTEPDRPVTGRPTVLLLNNSVDHHIGPNRVWVEWSRTMAAAGFRCVRVDLTGIGDSPARPGQPIDHPYGPASVTDIVEAAAGIDTGDGVVAVGLCSGARNALDAAAFADPAVLRGVCAINPPLHMTRRAIATLSPDDPIPDALRRTNAHRRVRARLAAAAPAWLGRSLDSAGIVRSRAQVLQRAVDRGVDVLVVFGTDDFHLQRVRRDSQWHLDRLAGDERFQLVTVDGVDHALFAPSGRAAVMQAVADHLLARYGSVGPAGEDLKPLRLS